MIVVTRDLVGGDDSVSLSCRFAWRLYRAGQRTHDAK